MKILGPEAFVVSKLLSAGPKRMRDYDDINLVIERNVVDLAIVRNWATKLNIGKKLKDVKL